MAFVECLKSLGLNDEEVEHFRKSTHLQDENIILKRAKFYQNLFNFTDSELKNFIVFMPPVLGYDTEGEGETSVKSKMKFYKKFFGFSESELVSFIKTYPAFLGYNTIDRSPTSFLGKIEYYKDKFGFSNERIVSIIKNSPTLITHNIEETIANRLAFYTETFGITEKEAIKMIKTFPNLLGYDEKSVLKKVEFYEKALNLSHKETLKIIKSLPSLLSYDTSSDQPTSVKSKIKGYEKIFDLAHEEAVEMIKRCPSILCYGIDGDETSIVRKLEYLKQIVDKKGIVKNPILLSHPALKVKLRYLILSKAFDKNEILESRKLITNEEKLWSRMMWLKENNQNVRKMIRDEGRIKTATGYTSAELIKQFPLTAEIIDNLEKEHFEKTGEKINISQRERKAVLGIDADVENFDTLDERE